MKKFFNKVKYSIGKIEKYPEMATEGTKAAIKYIAGVLILITIITCLGSIYQTYQSLQEVSQYIKDNVPEFTYKEGALSIEGEQPVIKDNLIIDTNDKTDEELQEYKNKLKENGYGFIVLKDKMLLVNEGSEDATEYPLSNIAEQINKEEIKKSDLIEYIDGQGMLSTYIGMFFIMFFSVLVGYLADALCVALVLAAVGYIVALLLKVKMRYKAIFNMALYALTLSTLLKTIYVVIRIFTTFTITYFDVMYAAVAFIYLVAAIFLTRIDLIKTQEELTKVKEVQKEVHDEIEEQKEKEKEEKDKENKDNKEDKEKNKKGKESKKEKKEVSKRQKQNGGEPEGSNV